jgi:hypothetical protein
MILKNVGKESLIFDKKYQRDEIINFLVNNPGCSKGDLVRGVKNIVSKRPLEKILQELKRDDLVKIEKEKPNSRAYKLFLCSENILIVLDNQIRDFNEEFKKLLQKVEAVIPELNLLPFTNKENRDKNFIMILFYEQLPLFILKYLMQCFLLKSIAVWPKIIQKKEIISKLNSLVFTEISKTVSDYSNFYNIKLSKSNIHNENYNPNISDELTKLENNILYFAFFLLICKKKGIAKEFENIVDKIWLINSDVQIYLHPEAIRYNLSYEYGKDDWRKYLKLYRQKIEELKNNKKQKLSDFIDHLSI